MPRQPRRFSGPVRLPVIVVVVVAVLTTAGVVAFRHAVDNHLSLRLPLSSICVVSAGSGAVAPGGSAKAAAGAAAPPGRSAPTATGTAKDTGTGGQGGGAADDDEVQLLPDRMANAATIAAVGLRRGVPRQGVVIALATALQESKLDNLDGGDRDSVGLFQQRPSQGWGAREQLSDPRFAANAFYAALVKVPGWQRMRITDAAQAVQRSAHPEAYERWATDAGVLATALVGEASGAVACNISGAPQLRGAAAADQLTADIRLDWGTVLATAAPADVPGLAVSVREARAGWQVAHWLVSHAEGHGVVRVRFADREWTSRTGEWRRATASGGADQVLAEVSQQR